ncbi:DUF1428 domain containing protein [Sulfitobacter noctilucae]|uniref:DUF1428 domain-containing protein n=1 Tax=Sulfitobacter noctilucae TaxID=1342302 RepID=UPI000A80F81D|nr:DUF1428 domain-containing protein [Sulfitobacter noctilucae]KIN75047.1 DUF1428 domain containing protein [Sulfitobacter noctilucae]
MYVMSFVAAVPTNKKEAYQTHSLLAAQVFKEHGALRVVECWGDFILPGEVTSYPMAVAAKEGETIVTGWQEWPDKETAHANMDKAMQDPRMADMEMPFDGKRMIFGGFETLVDA